MEEKVAPEEVVHVEDLLPELVTPPNVHRVGPSPHLNWDELACKDPGRTPYPPEWREDRGARLARGYEALRRECGDKPLIVLSGYRTPEHNAAEGGAAHGQHPKGTAVDVAKPPHLTYGEFVAAAFRAMEKCPEIRGIGVYKHGTSIHLDVRLDAPDQRLEVWAK